MKKFLKSQRGVTLIILVITIIIIAILTGAAIRKMDTGKDIRNYNYMCADIELLKNKVLAYNITLNYGGGTASNGDIYIVNEQSLEVYYLNGVDFEGITYYAKKK